MFRDIAFYNGGIKDIESKALLHGNYAILIWVILKQISYLMQITCRINSLLHFDIGDKPMDICVVMKPCNKSWDRFCDGIKLICSIPFKVLLVDN